MNIDELMEDIDKDFSITPTNLERKMYEAPALHSKYLKLFLKGKTRLAKLEKDLNILYREKYRFYAYDFEDKLENAKEIQFHIFGDAEYSDLKNKFENQKSYVAVIESVIKKTLQLTFDIKNITEYRKYLDGC